MNIIGCGRVGQTLAHLWNLHGVFAIGDVLTRSLGSAQDACAFVGAGTPVLSHAALRASNVWMLAVPDAQLAQAAAALAQAFSMPTNGPADTAPIAFHCSGALGAQVLAPLAAQGWRTASAHCILSFTHPAAAITQFAGAPCALEGNASACAVLHDAFTRIGAQCFSVASEDKLLYHAAAVFATNFLPVLQNVAEDAWRASGVPEQLIENLRAKLLHNAVANIVKLGPAGALTGPAARGDTAAIARQAVAVNAWNPAAGAAYEALSALALRLAGHRTCS